MDISFEMTFSIGKCGSCLSLQLSGIGPVSLSLCPVTKAMMALPVIQKCLCFDASSAVRGLMRFA